MDGAFDFINEIGLLKTDGEGRLGIEVEFGTSFRDESGRFISYVDSGVEDAIEEMARDGYSIALDLAPKGSKPDDRGPSITGGMYYTKAWDRKHGWVWGSTAKHALIQELGSKRTWWEMYAGKTKFYWEREGRMFKPGDNWIKHPGLNANPFPEGYLRPSLEAVWQDYADYLRRHLSRGVKW